LKRAVWLVVLAGVLGLGVFAAHRAASAGPAPREPAAADEVSKPKAGGKPAPVAVRVVSPQKGGIALTKRVFGRVQAYDRVDILPAVSGTLKSLDADVGDAVKKGHLLGVIDAPLLAIAEREAEIAVRQAKGQVRQEQAKLATVKAEVEVAKTVVTQRKADADAARAVLAAEQAQLRRVMSLVEKNIVDKGAVDEKQKAVDAGKARLAAATAAVENAVAELDVKRGKITLGEVAFAAAEEQVELANLALLRARYATSMTKLTAPFDGVVTARNVRAGHLLAGGEGRQPLLTIQRTDKVVVVVEVAEDLATLARPGVEAEVTIDSSRDGPLKGKSVSRVGFALDPKTRTMRVEIDVPNPKGRIRPGASGSVTLHLEKPTPGAVRVPVSSVTGPGPDRAAVYVVRDGKAHRTPVKLGHWGQSEVEVTSGLKPTDLIVTDPKGLTGEVVPVEAKEEGGAK
jgi:HlyD family secretion protein